MGEDKEPFEAVSLSVVDTSSQTVTLRLSGSVDPIANAVDDEYSLQLEVQLDREALAQMSAPATLTVKGSTEFMPAVGGDQLQEIEFTPDASASPILQSLFFQRSCFCGNMDSGQQQFDGALEVSDISEGEITGTLQVRLTGAVPNMSGAVDATVESEFNLAIPK